MSPNQGSCVNKVQGKNLRNSEEEDLHKRVSHQGYRPQLQVFSVRGEKLQGKC